MGKPACTVFKAYDVGLQAARDMHRIYWQARHPSCESDRRHVREPTRSMLDFDEPPPDHKTRDIGLEGRAASVP